MRRLAFVLGAAAFLSLGVSGVRAAESNAAFDFITHNEVQIAAAPANVWPHLRNVNAWKSGSKTAHFDGGRDVVGERFKVSPEGAENNFYFIETVELDPSKRWTIRLNGPNGELRGYATWTLAADGASTRLRYDTFLRSQLAGNATPNGTNRAASERMDGEFARLKRLVETAGAAK